MEFRLSSNHGLHRSRPRGRRGRALPIWAIVAIVAASLLSSQPAPVRAAAVAPDAAPATGLSTAPAGNLVDNGSFESPDIASNWVEYVAGATDITKWTIDSGKVDIVTNPPWEAPDGNQVLDLDGSNSGDSNGSISQTVPTTPNTAYELGFLYSGNPDCGDQGDVSMDVIWDGINVGTLTHDTDLDGGVPGSVAAFDYVQFTTAVTGSFTEPAGDGRTKLEFHSNSSPESTCGMVIDDVYVVHATPPVWQALGDGTTTVIEDGSEGPPQFTYSYDPGGGGGASGEWGFFTTATTSGPIDLDWSWTGLHAFAGVTVGLEAVVIEFDGGDVSTSVLAEGPKSCITFGCVGQSPSGGFSYVGTTTVNVEPGDTYGFALTGSNGDSNTSLTGRLVVNGTPALPLDCAGVLWRDSGAVDGDYTIQPRGQQPFEVFCDNMEGTPREYLTLDATGPGQNIASYGSGGASPGSDVVTKFTRVRLNPPTLLVDIGDLTYSTSSGSVTHPDIDGTTTVLTMPYGTAMACNSIAADNGIANIDLTGTPFAVDDTFTPLGVNSGSFGGATFSAGNQVVDIAGNGNCGWRTPFPHTENPPGPFYVFNPVVGVEQYGLQLTLDEPDETLPTPTLFASIARSGSEADLFARFDGAEDSSVTVEVRKGASCTNGVLASPVLIDTIAGDTDLEGYLVLEGVNGITSGEFVTIRAISPSTTDASLCVRTTADNDYWPKALNLGTGSSVASQDVVEIEGRARWYKIPIVPDQRVTVTLSGLSADYDLAVFRDIAKEFESELAPENADGLARIAAEFAPSVFSPSVFSPSVFSPSVFSPAAYSPSVFSPSVFSPSVFSPSVFSPSVFSPSVFSPSVFSPSVFSPSVFSPSVFSPSVFSPSVFSPSVFSEADVARAFSSAQTRSLIGVSATAGTATESVVVNTWNNTGFVYVRVAGRGGAFDPNDLFNVDVTKSASTCGNLTDTVLDGRAVATDAGQYSTIILTDSSKLALGDGSATSLLGKLTTFKVRPEVDGKVIDLNGDPVITALRAQVAANLGCPFAVNLLAEEIKSIVNSYRTPQPANPAPPVPEALRYVTIIGDDTVIPFFRYPDQSLLGQESGYFPPVNNNSISEASLRRDFVLSQDAYGSGVSVDIRTNIFPVPGLAVGRLVETPSEIAGMLDAYFTAGGVVAPQTSLVTGYDFLEDAAIAVRNELDAGTPQPVDTLITPNGVAPADPASWTASALRSKMFDSRHDMMFLAGHFSANSALAADFSTSVLTTELAASTVNLANVIVFSAGCHSGYNLVDGEALAGVSLPLDWAQAFAQKRSILIAGTGYQYGDTDFLEYSERLYRDFAKQLRAGEAGTNIAVGEALARAKRIYLATTPDIRGIHEKAILEATLFGLPMFGVNMPTGRGAIPGSIPTITPNPVTSPALTNFGLATHDLEIETNLTAPKSKSLQVIESTGVTGSVTATWIEGPDGVVTNPAEPAIPKYVIDATSTNATQVLRGVGFRGGEYTDTANVLPLTGAPTTELRGVHAPFVSPVFYPMKLSTPNYFGELGGNGGTNLIVTPVQHKSDPGHANRTIRRAFSDLDLRLFYSSNLTDVALSDAPTIVKVETVLVGDDLMFSAQVVGDPKAAIHEVWLVWTDGNGPWVPLDLTQSTTDTREWTGTLLDAPANIRFVAQAVNGVGLVAFDDNRGQYYQAGGLPTVATTLTLVPPVPTAGQVGDSASVTAELKAGDTPLANKQIVVTIGGSSVTGITGSNGRATVTVPLSAAGSPGIVASFFGDATHVGSTVAAPFSIGKGQAALTAITPFVTTTATKSAGVVTTLTVPTNQPLMQTTVTVTLTGPVTKTLSLITNHLGQVSLPLGLPPGAYTVSVVFAGNESYLGVTRTGPLVIAPFTGFFSPVDSQPTLNTVNAGSSIPVKFSLGGNRGLAIFAPGYPLASKITCESGLPVDAIEETTTAASGLVYDAAANQYKYTWKTPKTYAGLCYRLDLKMIDGSAFSANFKFK